MKTVSKMEIVSLIHVTPTSVPDKRRVSGQKPATATRPDTDKHNNCLRYSYKSKYCPLCNPPPEKLYDPLPKKINWNTALPEAM